MTMTFKKSTGDKLKSRTNPSKKKSKKKHESRDLREDRGTRQSKLGTVKNKSRR